MVKAAADADIVVDRLAHFKEITGDEQALQKRIRDRAISCPTGKAA
jgi:hypothetical protein